MSRIDKIADDLGQIIFRIETNWTGLDEARANGNTSSVNERRIAIDSDIEKLKEIKLSLSLMQEGLFPKAKFSFGQKVVVHWHEVECGTTKAVITGINYNRHKMVVYTVSDENGNETDEIDEDMLTAYETVSFCKEMTQDELADRLVERMGGRGKCNKCGEMVNNVAYHEAHDCDAVENVIGGKVECPNCGQHVGDLSKHLSGCCPA